MTGFYTSCEGNDLWGRECLEGGCRKGRTRMTEFRNSEVCFLFSFVFQSNPTHSQPQTQETGNIPEKEDYMQEEIRIQGRYMMEELRFYIYMKRCI